MYKRCSFEPGDGAKHKMSLYEGVKIVAKCEAMKKIKVRALLIMSTTTGDLFLALQIIISNLASLCLYLPWSKAFW